MPCRVAEDREIDLRVACAVMEYRLGLGPELLLRRLDEALAEAKFKAIPGGPSRAVFRLSPDH